MAKIKTLSEHVIAKTAAGEVVERPASVVKELIDNSLDALAKNITVEIVDAGFSSIRIFDDGEGMDEYDLRLSYLPHTTSKIFIEDDLTGIKTYGFRGEALSSICSVARVIIQSRLASEALGLKVEIEKGIANEVTQVGMPCGTEIIVKDLFYNVPARKKFLKNEKTEYRNILDIFMNAALANPSVGFTFISNAKEILNLKGYQTPLDRLNILLGKSVVTNLLPIKFDRDHFELAGFLSKPQLATEGKGNQYIFVNNRPVNNAVISNAVKEAYGGLLEPRSHPAFVLFIKLPYDLVDVNVHPRKEQVRFWDDTYVSDFIYSSVLEALKGFDLTYNTDLYGNSLDYATRDKKSAEGIFHDLKDSVDKWDMRQPTVSNDVEILQVNKLYLVTSNKDGLVLVDQHAAHERILYEQFLKEYSDGKQASEAFVIDNPNTFELPIKDSEILREHLSVFIDLGFDLEEFGEHTYRVRKMPKVFKEFNIKSLVLEVLDNINLNKKDKSPNKKILQTISYLACRGAIKAGDVLTHAQRKDLLLKLSETTSNYTCPHGRPVKVEVPFKELHKLFKRIK